MKKKKSIKDLTDAEFRKETMNNHIWINAFATIRPTEKFLIGIGETVLEQLEGTKFSDEFGLSPTVLLHINKS